MRALLAQATVRALPREELATQAFSRSWRTRGRAVCQLTGSRLSNYWLTVKDTRGPRGYDGGKKVNGRKRHLLVDTQGLVIKAKVHPADVHDKEGAKLLLGPLAGKLPRMAKVWVDSAYQGLKKWTKDVLGWDLEVVKHWWTGLRWVWVPEGQEPPALDIPAGFQVLPRRRVVERTFGWLGRNRRLSKDYEALPQTEEAFIYLSMIRLMLRRRANSS